MGSGTLWADEELLVAFRLYCRLPFGRLHKTNPEIVTVARHLGRTPSAVAMKACNFAGLDPSQAERGVKALQNASAADRRLWDAFQRDPESVAATAEAEYERITAGAGSETRTLPNSGGARCPSGPTESLTVARVRRVQGFFRDAVMASYDAKCALSGMSTPELLNASHIIPWKDDVKRRADPRNGILLNALYDRAFDRGLITFSDAFCVIVSGSLKLAPIPDLQERAFVRIDGRCLRLPNRFAPDLEAIDRKSVV